MNNYTPDRKTHRKIQSDNFVLTEVRMSPGRVVPPHVHEANNLVCVIDGHFFQKFDRRDFHCTPRSFLSEPIGAVHSNRYLETGAHSLMIRVRTEKGLDSGPISRIFDDVFHADANGAFSYVSQLIKEISQPDELSAFAIEGLTLELLTYLNRSSGKESSGRDSRSASLIARDYIHDNFMQKLSLAIVAREVGMHPSHLARLFRARFNTSIGEYIRGLRLSFAADQLSDTSKRLSDISLDAGFYDQSHFTNHFKRHYGVTPAEFRKLKS